MGQLRAASLKCDAGTASGESDYESQQPTSCQLQVFVNSRSFIAGTWVVPLAVAVNILPVIIMAVFNGIGSVHCVQQFFKWFSLSLSRGFYTQSASEAIFRARAYSHNLFSPVMMITW